MGGPTGDPDVASTQGLSVTATVTGNPVTEGEWSVLPSVVGPFGTTGATPRRWTRALTATTAVFDPAVTSDTGDLWQASIGAPLTVSPVVVQPGQSATIPVIIAPSGADRLQSVRSPLPGRRQLVPLGRAGAQRQHRRRDPVLVPDSGLEPSQGVSRHRKEPRALQALSNAPTAFLRLIENQAEGIL